MLIRRKRLGYFILFSFVIFIFFAFKHDHPTTRKIKLTIFQSYNINCYKEPSNKDSFPEFNVRTEQERLSSGKNIFFHETSCFNSETNYRAELNCRQACAVESAARANLGMTVNLLFLSPSAPSTRTKELVGLLSKYDNVRVNRVLVEDYVKDTPLESWYADGILRTSRWPRSHMSDIMRYLTLWRYGGIYLDLDVVITKSLEGLSNFAGAQDWGNVAAGVIGLSNNGLGRHVANAFIRDLLINFRGNKYANNGPGVITRTLKRFCAVESVKDMTSSKCRGFDVYPPSVFYPIHHDDWKLYFTEDKSNETMHFIEQAKAIHVWNKFSAAEIVNVGSKVPYALIAEQHCPRVYNGCGSTF